MKAAQVIMGRKKFLLGIATGFGLFWFTSHKQSPLHRKIPAKSYKKVIMLPSIKILWKDRHIHLHHWINIGLVYGILFFLKRNYLSNTFLQGFLIGSILQGLYYHDRFSFVYKPQNLNEYETH